QRELREQGVAGGEVRIPERRPERPPVRGDREQPGDVVVEDVVRGLEGALAEDEVLQRRVGEQREQEVETPRPGGEEPSDRGSALHGTMMPRRRRADLGW